jgi:eukaryotic-like serine/threonine-protein kinase
VTNLSDAAIGRLRAAVAAPGPLGERYELVEELGRGGMGVVYRALDRELDRDVAVKVPHDSGVVLLEPRLRSEARVLAALEHPGIVPIHDIGRLGDGRAFYVMKLVRGRTLRDHLADLTEMTDRLRIFERICEPVAFAHAHGCVHRDLKPENVMIGEFGEVMVMDWGVARRAGSARQDAPTTAGPDTQSGLVVGTHGFMAPEQAAAQLIDHRADVYSLGALLVLLLTGRPIEESDPAAAIRRQPDLPRALRSICAKALQPAPGGRYQSVEALAADVARFRAGLAVEAHEETLAERLVRFGRTYRAAILLVLAYIVMRVLVAALAGW